MEIFNSFQLTCLFAAWPFIIQWLHGLTFYGSGALTVAATVAYGIQFIATIFCYAEQMRRI